MNSLVRYWKMASKKLKRKGCVEKKRRDSGFSSVGFCEMEMILKKEK